MPNQEKDTYINTGGMAEAIAEDGTVTTVTVEVPPPEAGLTTGGIVLLVVLSPFLVVLAILFALVWIVLLPFQSCLHHHDKALTVEPPALTEDLEGGGERGQYFQSKTNGAWLFYRRWMPANKPRGIVYAAHGFGEHISRAGYYALARTLNERGYALLALDHQGHGRSTGDRAFFESIDDVVADYIQFMQIPVEFTDNVNFAVEKVDASVPRFIFGHSMGGLIALSAAVQSQTLAYRSLYPSFNFRGVILSSPCLAVDPELATPPLKVAAQILSSLLPKLVLKGIPAEYLSRNPAAVASYVADPLIWHGGARARVGAEMLREMKEVLAQLPTFTLPIILTHGTKDAVVPLFASSLVYTGVGSKDKTFKQYTGLFHEMFEDKVDEQPRFLNDIGLWLDAHTSAAYSAALATAQAPVASPSRFNSNGQVSRSTSVVHFHGLDD